MGLLREDFCIPNFSGAQQLHLFQQFKSTLFALGCNFEKITLCQRREDWKLVEPLFLHSSTTRWLFPPKNAHLGSLYTLSRFGRKASKYGRVLFLPPSDDLASACDQNT